MIAIPSSLALPAPEEIARLPVGQVQAMLKGYVPKLAQEVIEDPEFLHRRALLWQRLDHLLAAWRRRQKEPRS
jgi:hypothetical protein